MKSRKMLTILVLALCLVVWPAKVSQAAPMGTAFTYQGRLIDANSAADGLYDFQFRLFDDPNVIVGTQVGDTIDINELDVIDGYFTVDLDFGSDVFAGDARWLEIGVRPGELEDPNAYTPLLPRQEVTPTPYAIYAETAGGDNDWRVSGNNMYSIPSGTVSVLRSHDATGPGLKVSRSLAPPFMGQTWMEIDDASIDTYWRSAQTIGTTLKLNSNSGGGVILAEGGGNVGIGTVSPETKLHLYTGAGGGSNPSSSADPLAIETSGNAYINIITPTDGWAGIMFSDNVRNRGIVSYDHEFDKMYFYTAGAIRAVIDSSGHLGIGTTTPGEKLHVVGNMKVVDSSGNDAVVLQPDGLGSAGRISMYDTDGDETVRLVAAESSTSGAELILKDVDGTITIELDGDYAGTGGYIALRQADGTQVITLDADYSGDGRIITQELQITGGSDLSEQFDIDGVKDAVKAGMVVSIDPKRPGKLLISKMAYDNKVAGIISGAGGVKPGMMMGQKGSAADGVYPVALTGRVYCWADASTGAIQPGDLLTTSSVPGHAMKVSEHSRALGAIIGKAMTSLEKGKGLILVLVSLQ